MGSANPPGSTLPSLKIMASKATRMPENMFDIGSSPGCGLRRSIGVHLIRAELFDELREAGHSVGPGDLGENITTTGLQLEHLPLGSRLHLGEKAVVELTGLRTPCALIDRFQKGLRGKMVGGTDVPKFKCGVLGVVVAGGSVEPGDGARVKTPSEPFSPLPAM
jgi:MOSC domain-containing protein YiiM